MRLYIRPDQLDEPDSFEHARSQVYEQDIPPEQRKERLVSALNLGKLASGETIEDVILENITRPAKQAAIVAEDRLAKISDDIANAARPRGGFYYQFDVDDATGEIKGILRVLQLPDESAKDIEKKRIEQKRLPSGPVINTIRVPGITPKGPNG